MGVLMEIEIGSLIRPPRRPGRYENVTARLLGDPAPERSALAERRAARAARAARAGANGVPEGKLCRIDAAMKRVIPAEGMGVMIDSRSVLRVLEIAADGRRRRLSDVCRHFKGCSNAGTATALRRANADLARAALRFVIGSGDVYWLEAIA